MTTLTTGKATEFIQFTRASNATVTDSDGKVKWAPHNLLTNSESFDASAWVKSASSTVTANSIAAPNGATTADLITNVAQFGGVSQFVNLTAGATYTLCFWARVNTGTNVYSVVDNSGGLGIISTFTPTASWALYTFTFTPSSTSATLFPAQDRNASGFGSIYLWGAHLYRSDLGGMQANTSAYPMYNPTTPKNLLGYTEDFSNAAWVRANIAAFGSGSVANVTLAPNGLQTADLIVESTATGLHSVYQTFSCISGAKYAFSVYVKPAGRTIVRLSPQATATLHIVEFDLTGAGTATTRAGSGTAAITALSDGWYRISTIVTATASGTGFWQFDLCNAANSANYAGDGVSGAYLWGAQLSDSASLDSYVPVYGAAVTSAAYYGPRRDFDPVTLACKGLLVEEQRTNLARHSNEINNSGSWTPDNATVGANAAVGPDGVASAESLTENTATGNHRVFSQTTLAANTTVTASAFVRRGTGTRNLFMSWNWGDGIHGHYDLGSGTVINATANGTGSLVSATITAVGGGWYRVTLTGIASVANANPYIQFYLSNSSSNIGSTAPSYTGDGTSSLLIWGAQVEAGSFATSYIPTGAATATRNGDVASVSTQAFPYNQPEGTIIANVVPTLSIADNTRAVWFSDGTNRVLDMYIGSGNWTVFNGSTFVSPGTPAAVKGAISKIGAVYKSGDYASVLNGGAAGTASSALVNTGNNIHIGCASAGNLQLNGHIRQITYLPRRISNTELVTRTSA